MHNNRNRQNQQQWQQNPNRENNHSQHNYDYGNYTSGNRNDESRHPNHGSYEGAPSGYQHMNYPGNPNPYDGMHGHNDYGYAGGNPDFTSAAGEYRGNDWRESNYGHGVGTGRTDGFYGPHNDRQTDMGNHFSGNNNHYNHPQEQRNARPMGQTMDSWDNDDNHWHSRKDNDQQNNDGNDGFSYRSYNQGYFGENIPPHSGGQLYNERFSNNDDYTRRSRIEDRWHADSLSDRNIEGWGR